MFENNSNSKGKQMNSFEQQNQCLQEKINDYIHESDLPYDYPRDQAITDLVNRGDITLNDLLCSWSSLDEVMNLNGYLIDLNE